MVFEVPRLRELPGPSSTRYILTTYLTSEHYITDGQVYICTVRSRAGSSPGPVTSITGLPFLDNPCLFFAETQDEAPNGS